MKGAVKKKISPPTGCLNRKNYRGSQPFSVQDEIVVQRSEHSTFCRPLVFSRKLKSGDLGDNCRPWFYLSLKG